MKIVDVNVLLNSVNSKSAGHDRALRWWEAAVNGDESIGLAWIVLGGFIRISTNPRLYSPAFTIAQATGLMDEWLGHENIRLVTETADHWEVFRRVLELAGTAGNLTTDAHLAALAICHDATLVSFDADFGRFKRLRWENPASA